MGNRPYDASHNGVFWLIYGTPTAVSINLTSPVYCTLSTLCTFMIHHLDEQKKLPFMYLYLLSMCIYVWVRIVVCTGRRVLFFFFFCFFRFLCGCVILCALYTVWVRGLACVRLYPDGKRGNGWKKTARRQVKHGMRLVLGFQRPMCRGVHKGELLPPDGWEAVEVLDSGCFWLQFELSLTFEAVLKAAVHYLILFVYHNCL